MSELLFGFHGEELKSFYELGERFAKKELAPKALELDRYPHSQFNESALKAAAEIGLFNLTLPESFGGSGQGMTALSVILPSLASADASFGAVVFIQIFAQSAIVRWAKKEIAEKYLKPKDRGLPRLCAFPVYAPPTDLPLEVKALKEGDSYSLTGKISSLALAPVAEIMIIPAEVQGSGQASFFIVEKNSSGVKVSEPVLGLGLHNCPVADVELWGVKVPLENLLGGEGQASEDYPEFYASFGGALASLSLGVLIGSFRTAKSFAEERYQGGKQIIEHDQVRMMLANMALLIETGETICLNASRAVDQGKGLTQAFAGGIFLTDAVTRATTDGVQCLGGYGYMHDYGQEKRMRDAKQIQAMFGPSPLKRLELMETILRREG